MPGIESPGEVPGVNVSDSQGVLIGSGNQYNTWGPARLDPIALSGLNPHVAVTRLQPLSHDELVDFFARAKPEDVSEILEVFLEADRLRMVAVLGDINARRATELIGAVRRSGMLPKLPEAAQEIARKAADFRWIDAEPLRLVMDGYVRRYKGGRVFWSPEFGAHVTVGAVDDYLRDRRFGALPVGDEEPAQTSPYGTEGTRQKFKSHIVFSSKHGVFAVYQTELYEHEGDSGGWLGFPTGKGENRRSIVEDEGRSDLHAQNFEGGMIFTLYVKWDDLESVFAVRREVAGVLPDQGWRPVSEEITTVSSSGREGAVQHLEFHPESGTYGTAVYSSDDYGVTLVAPEVWDYYSKLGAEKSWLGFPVTQAVTRTSGLVRQHFEEGTIYFRPRIGPIAVRQAVEDYIFQDRDLLIRLGFPVSEEHSVDAGESDRIQFFSGGVVTMRDGKYEVWLRSEPKADSKTESPLEPDTTATPDDAPALPWGDYDKLSLAKLNLRLLRLSVEQIKHLLDYEKSNRARADVIATLERRIALVERNRKG